MCIFPEQEPDAAVSLVHYHFPYESARTGKGHDELTARIIDLAREHEIPIQENALLAHLLSGVELNVEIPRELCLSVARAIAFACRLSRKLSG